MNKIKKYFKISVFCLVLLVVAVSVSAINFDNKPVKTMQNHTTFSIGTITEATTWAHVKLTGMSPVAVVFSVSECKGEEDCNYYGNGIVYDKDEDLNKVFAMGYKGGATMPKGAKAQGRYRNYNWSLNANFITGWFDYNY